MSQTFQEDDWVTVKAETMVEGQEMRPIRDMGTVVEIDEDGKVYVSFDLYDGGPGEHPSKIFHTFEPSELELY